MGVALFCRFCVRDPRIKTRLRDLLLHLIKTGRDGEHVDKDLIKSSTQMLLEMGKDVYHEVRARWHFGSPWELPACQSVTMVPRTFYVHM